MSKSPEEQISRVRVPRIPETPEEYENLNIALAMKLSTERLRDGTASAKEIMYWVEKGSIDAQLKRDMLRGQIQLTDAKVDAISSERQDKEVYQNAIDAMTKYQPSNDDSDFIEGEYRDYD